MLSVEINLIGVPAFVVDVSARGEFRLAAINHAEELAIGKTAAEVVGRPLTECLPKTVVAHVTARFSECVGKRAVHSYDEMLDIPGKAQWWRTTLTPVIDPKSGDVTQLVGIAVEITERKKTEDDLLVKAFQDPLTSLANRARFELDIEDCMAEAVYTRRGFGIAVIDLDGFKPINDRYGHRRGDDVLRHVASLLKLTARETETVARIGGDEFAMRVTAATETELNGKVEALRRFVDRALSISDIGVQVGASIGSAMWTGGITFGELFDIADADMYRRKALRKSLAA
jgi:diguanylate cyclase (GGDEF)-like protein/PAS domain S-box-containing protein